MNVDLFTPVAHYNQRWSGSIAIVSPGHIPTVDFYITSRLKGVDSSNVFRFETLDIDAAASALPMGTFVIIVRHTSSAWIKFIEAHSNLWSGVAYLMDDDIPNAILCRDIPFDYAMWTSSRYLQVRKGLARVCDRVWLSTEPLMKRYKHVKAHLMPPQYFGEMRKATPAGVKRWGYHGTRVHKREIKWLLPIVSAVQEALPEAEFEVFGDGSVARQFRGIPRVHVIPAMSWVDYLQYCDSANLAVSLAPMLKGRFNDARSYTKAFDIARCGAIGVFSMSEPYHALQAGSGASVLQNNQAQWVKEIVSLLQDDAMRLEKYQQFSQWIEDHSSHQSLSAVISPSSKR